MVSKKFLGKKTKSLKRIGEKLISEVAQTAAKKPSQFSENFSPVFLQSGKGAYVKDLEGNTFLDTIMGIGPIILGYNHPDTNKAIINQLKNGINFSLTHPIEIQLAVELKSILPNMDMFRFSKTGVDVTTAAIRAARNFTQKNKILSCGYHGWHDWNAITLNKNSGVPKFNSKLIKKFQYNNFEQMADNIDNDTAAVIMEPIIFEYPKDNFLKKIRKITKQKNILLIFDEMWTGFRFPSYSFQEYIGVTPHLSIFSKGIANGYTISAIVGRKDIMDEFNNVWGFTTFGGDALSISAAIKNIERIEETNAIEYIWSKGLLFQKEINQLLIKYNLNDKIFVSGYPCRFKLDFKQDFDSKNAIDIIKKTFLENGILWNNMFVFSLAHKGIHLQKTLSVFNNALSKI